MFNDLQKLVHFVEIARLGSYAAAADALGIAQPTLTRSVQTLERQVAGRLLDRGRNGAVPTALGEELLARASALINAAAKAEREMQMLAGVGSGQVRVGAGAYPADISIGLAAGRFSQRFPGVSIDISVSDWSALIPQVLSGSIDFAVAEAMTALDDARLAIDLLPTHQGVLFCRSGHPALARGDDLTLDELSAYPYASATLPRRVEDAFVTDNTASAFPLRYRADTLEVIRRIVLGSDALAAATPAQLRSDVEAGRVAVLPITLPELHTAYGIIRLAGRSMSPAAEAFADILREVEAEIAAGETKQAHSGNTLST